MFIKTELSRAQKLCGCRIRISPISQVYLQKSSIFKVNQTTPAADDISKNQTPRHVIVLSAFYRSGSTLTGTLFDRNPHLMYYFEPLSAFRETPEAKILEPKLSMLSEMFKCKAPDIRRFKQYANQKSNKKWLQDGIAQFYASHR